MSGNEEFDLHRLLELARAGDGPALGRLLEAYRQYLTLLARIEIDQRLQGKVSPSDLVQETFMEVHHGFGRFRGSGEAEFLAWLRQILVTNLVDAVRRYCKTKGRDVRLERQLADEVDRSSQALDRGLVAPGASPSQQAARREQAVLLADALGRLPADYREAIILRNLEGLSFPEVARRMGRTIDSVEKLWVRALTQLRRSLEGLR